VSVANDVSGGGLSPQSDFSRTAVRYPHPAARTTLPTRGRDKKAGIVANENARALRKRLTPQEVKLWVRLRELKPLGYHFRRKAPIGRYIVDFVSFRSQLVIEADGGQHGMPEGDQADRARDAFLGSQGFRILRFWNSDIDANLAGVMEGILSALKQSPTA
jgi:very-short-patch-repair endonuclease